MAALKDRTRLKRRAFWQDWSRRPPLRVSVIEKKRAAGFRMRSLCSQPVPRLVAAGSRRAVDWRLGRPGESPHTFICTSARV